MRVSILQPTYWARAHVWNRVLCCDVFVWLDHVKFSRSSTKWEDRTIIEGRDGRAVVLRLPLRGSRNALWSNAGLNDGWRKHAQTIQQCYSRAPYWQTLVPLIESVYGRAADTIDEVCWRSFKAVHGRLGGSCEVLRSSSLGVETAKGELVLDIVRKLGGTTYISGAPGMDYLPVEEFKRADVKIVVQDWLAPKTAGGLQNPSLLHLLAHYGPTGAAAIIGSDGG